VEIAKMVGEGIRWDIDRYSRSQYISMADELCSRMEWGSYAHLLETGLEQQKWILSISGNHPFDEFHRVIIEKIWSCKQRFPHLFFNSWLSNDHNLQEHKEFIEMISAPVILISKEHIQFCALTESEVKKNAMLALDMLHIYSTAMQLLCGSDMKGIKCYQRFFQFTCPQSNGKCGTIPSRDTPVDCPFMLWIKRFGLC
jgi:hypothetical protein